MHSSQNSLRISHCKVIESVSQLLHREDGIIGNIRKEPILYVHVILQSVVFLQDDICT